MKKKILIVEDEHYLAELYQTKLELSGYEVVGALEGEEGLEKAREHRPDLILLDIIMPGMDGYKFLRRLKEDEKIKDIPVYIFSNLGQPDEIKRGINEGAQKYLIKANITPGRLVEIIDQALGKK